MEVRNEDTSLAPPAGESGSEDQRPGQSRIRKPWIWFAILGVALALAAMVSIVWWSGSGTTTVVDESIPRTASDHSPGWEVTIYLQGRNSVTVAVDEKALDELISAMSMRGDGLDRLLQSGRVFDVPNKTRARIIEASSSKLKVRILEGDKMMHEVWVPERWVR